MAKALTEEQITEVRRRKAAGETDQALAIEYHVHYRTIQNYCKSDRKPPMHRKHFLNRFMGVR